MHLALIFSMACTVIVIALLFVPFTLFFPDKTSYLSQGEKQKDLWQPIDRDMARWH